MKNSLQQRVLLTALFFVVMLYLSGCQTMQSALNKTREMLGAEKRDILISEVKDARVSLEEVKAQFQLSMERFNTVLVSGEGKLEEKHKALKSEYEDSAKKAEDIQKNIDSVAKAAEALFSEWEAELNQYTSETLRRSSEQRLQEAKSQNARFIKAMTRANEQAGPVLIAFSDLVLFSRHNLNAQAMDSLNSELKAVGEKVSSFIEEIEASISEADALINLMGGNESAE